MFTGIIETLGRVEEINIEGSNLTFTISSSFSNELKIDQSLAHNGVCLTVIQVSGDQHKVTAVSETLTKTNLGALKTGDAVNLERCTTYGGRMDGHMVYGHVDTTGKCVSILDQNGSWLFTFSFSKENRMLIVEKGSIAINGTSLTVFAVEDETFLVAIIPYTFEHTILKYLKVGEDVNLEFDILGKYVNQYLSRISGK